MSWRLDDVALREVFKSVDAGTLQKCRQVCFSWNEEIRRLNKYTRKFNPKSVIMELNDSCFRVYLGTPNSPKPFEEHKVTCRLVRRILQHTFPPQILNILIEENVDGKDINQMMSGMNKEWSTDIKELEVVIYSVPNLSNVLSNLSKFNSVARLSLSHYCNDRMSCADIFSSLPELRFLRIFAFNGNDGSDVSSGLVFDESAVEALLKSQHGVRRIQKIELYNTDVCVSMDTMINALQELARLPMHQDNLEEPMFPEDQEESIAIHLLFDHCRWEIIKELNLLSAIIRISSESNFPIHQESEDILRGDFRFRIFDTQFVLKFMTC